MGRATSLPGFLVGCHFCGAVFHGDLMKGGFALAGPCPSCGVEGRVKLTAPRPRFLWIKAAS